MNQTEVCFSPSDFIAVSNQAFEHAMPFVSIEGELSEFKVRKDKWVYFKVKDEYASVDCFGTVYMLPGPIEDGMIVRVSGRPRLHERFGFSFNVNALSPTGEGSIQKALELLRAKLEKEGLFSVERKRSLPYPAERVGVITSQEGAALGDFTKVLRSRWGSIEVEVIDSFVQGARAVDSIVSAIATANTKAGIDVLVITRGGGSAEDMSAYNDERVVRAIASSRIPTLVAIGHEQDVCLAELAADKRASTPSNAAELLSPDVVAERKHHRALQSQASSLLSGVLAKLKTQRAQLEQQLKQQAARVIAEERRHLQQSTHIVELLNPTNILKRGYAIVRSQGSYIKKAARLKSGAKVELVFDDGSKRATIDQ